VMHSNLAEVAFHCVDVPSDNKFIKDILNSTHIRPPPPIES
jgi:hypothetical protein